MTDSPGEYYEHYNNDEERSPSETSSDWRAYPNSQNAYQMGTDPRADRAAARVMMGDPDLMHDYDHDPQNRSAEQSIVTGNTTRAPAITYTPNWGNPSLHQLAEASYSSHTQFGPEEPDLRFAYENTAGQLIDARVRQNLSRTAYGTLAEISEYHDPRDPRTQHAVDTSVHAAFDVMTSAASFNAQRQDLAARQAQREAERARTERGKGSADRKRRNKDGSPSEGRPSKHHRPSGGSAGHSR